MKILIYLPVFYLIGKIPYFLNYSDASFILFGSVIRITPKCLINCLFSLGMINIIDDYACSFCLYNMPWLAFRASHFRSGCHWLCGYHVKATDCTPSIPLLRNKKFKEKINKSIVLLHNVLHIFIFNEDSCDFYC